MLDGKKILITGGTGSLGQSLTKRLLATNVDTVRILSRNESKQVNMESEFNDKRLRFLIGDVRDFERLKTAFEDIDIVYHAAALKHVPVIEYNPFEAIKTNVQGSQNVIDASLSQDVERVICIGTDKAVSPLNTYGATKLLMEKLFVSANNFLNETRHRTKFLALRYGNVVGSSGSVIPKFIRMIKEGRKITITDSEMTRFSITMDQALDFILDCTINGNASEIYIPKFIKMINEGKKITITDSEMTRFSITMEQVLDFIIDCTLNGKSSEIYVPKLKSYSIMDVKDALFDLLGKTDFNVVGIRPGEKLHEEMITINDSFNTLESKDYFIILPPNKVKNYLKKNKNYRAVKENFSYNSFNNNHYLKIPDIEKIIKRSQ